MKIALDRQKAMSSYNDNLYSYLNTNYNCKFVHHLGCDSCSTTTTTISIISIISSISSISIIIVILIAIIVIKIAIMRPFCIPVVIIIIINVQSHYRMLQLGLQYITYI